MQLIELHLLKMKVSHIILAYDTDYEDYNQLKEVEKKYSNIFILYVEY